MLIIFINWSKDFKKFISPKINSLIITKDN